MTEQEQHVEPSATHLSMRDVGRILADAREQASLSIEDAAARLCLRPQQLEALETGTMDALPGQTFVRGFIRSYAKLLHLDAEPLVEAHRRHAPAGAAGQISLQCEHIPIVEPSRHSKLPFVQMAIVIGMVVGAWMVYMDYFAAGRLAWAPTAQQEFAENAPLLPPAAPPAEFAPDQPPMTDTTGMVAGAPLPTQPEVTTEASPAAQPDASEVAVAPAVPTATTGVTLKLAFSQPSWVRIRDRDGKDLLNKTAIAGAAEEVAGIPPFRLEIGNTAGVQLSYNEQAVDLAPYTRANVARFTLE